MRRFWLHATLALACALVTFTCARAADVAPVAPADKDFVTKATTISSAVIKMSKLAETRADNEKVKAFAHEMSKGHHQLNEQLEEVANKMKLVVLPEYDKDIRGTLEGLSSLKGAEFDLAYVTRMVQDHEKAAKLFESEAEHTTNPDLKKFCSNALTELQAHLKEARTIADSLKK